MLKKDIISALLITSRSRHYVTKKHVKFVIRPSIVVSYRGDEVLNKLLELKECGYYTFPDYERALKEYESIVKICDA